MANFTDWASLQTHIERQVDNVDKSVRRFAKAVAKEGEELTREFTNTRGTRTSKGPGRVDTGEMVNAITSGVDSEGPDHIRTYFGWNDAQDYFAYQTSTGFVHWMTGEYIEPTYALRDATAEVEATVDEWIARGGR